MKRKFHVRFLKGLRPATVSGYLADGDGAPGVWIGKAVTGEEVCLPLTLRKRPCFSGKFDQLRRKPRTPPSYEAPLPLQMSWWRCRVLAAGRSFPGRSVVLVRSIILTKHWFVSFIIFCAGIAGSRHLTFKIVKVAPVELKTAAEFSFRTQRWGQPASWGCHFVVCSKTKDSASADLHS
jgi:hypothetical protein